MNNSMPILLDSFDKAILRALQDDGRISNQDLAEKIGLTPSLCLRRTKKREADGVIER